MSTDNNVKALTENMLKYMLSDKERRKKIRKMRKEQRDPFLSRWFGVLPLAIAYHRKHRQHKKAKSKG